MKILLLDSFASKAKEGMQSAAKKCNLPLRKSLSLRTTKNLWALCLILFLSVATTHAQESRIAQQINAKASIFNALQPISLLDRQSATQVETEGMERTLREANFLTINDQEVQRLFVNPKQHLLVRIATSDQVQMNLKLVKANFFTPEFQVKVASDQNRSYPIEEGLYYWGIIEGQPNSLVAIAITRGEIMGFIQIDEEKYTLGKLDNREDGLHVLYLDDDLLTDPGVSCHVVDDIHFKGTEDQGGSRQSPDNCVKMYIEVDYDIVVGKGGVQSATDYVLGALSQVAIMYANENINFAINELLVWDIVDPYTGPSTGQYLDQFRLQMGGNFNGDLAHLIGYTGGGGVAYVDVICNKPYAVGYSAINPTYNNVPTYSWTVSVLTHEIGHNLGSWHTHSCVWNGNNTAIDGCGPAAGYSEGCNGPIPASGTIMSYCHLVAGVGINFNNGFGQQPGDLIRNRVYNAACISSCAAPIMSDAGIIAILAPESLPCVNFADPVVTLQNFGANTLTQVAIHYQLDNGTIDVYNWTGSLAQNSTTDVTLPTITYGLGQHSFRAYTNLPNGVQDEVPANDESATSFNYSESNCGCNEDQATISPNPLTHSGSGSSSASVSLIQGSKDVNFVISNLDAKLTGGGKGQYNERVIVSYTDGFGNILTYGTFLGSQQGSVNVSIAGSVNSVNINLSNGLNNNFSGTLSVSFSDVTYCNPEPPCSDIDEDGVCDEDDICPGFDDNLIGTACDDGDPCTGNDAYTTACICVGIAIPGCGEECPNINVSQFSSNPLSHKGTGFTTSLVGLPSGNANISFVVNGLDAKLDGKTNLRYDDLVTITYVDGLGNTQNYGQFLGSQMSSVSVNILGFVQSVTVALSDGYDGNTDKLTLSVSMSPVTSCGPAPIFGDMNQDQWENVQVFPNPASSELFVRFDDANASRQIKLYNPLGVLVGDYRFDHHSLLRIDLSSIQVGNHLLFVQILEEGKKPIIRSVVVQK